MLEPGVDEGGKIVSDSCNLKFEPGMLRVVLVDLDEASDGGVGSEASVDSRGLEKWPVRAFRNGIVIDTVTPFPGPRCFFRLAEHRIVRLFQSKTVR